MRMMFRLLTFFICLNLGFYLVNYCADLTGAPSESMNSLITPSQIATDFNATRQVESWTSYPSMFGYIGDVVAGLSMMFRFVVVFFVGFPYFLYEMGAPSVIVSILGALWAFVWSWSIWEWISGRRASD